MNRYDFIAIDERGNTFDKRTITKEEFEIVKNNEGLKLLRISEVPELKEKIYEFRSKFNKNIIMIFEYSLEEELKCV